MIKFLHKKISNFIHNQRGISAVACAGFLLLAVTVTTIGFNINRTNQIRAALQALADQSVLSAQSILAQSTLETSDAVYMANLLTRAKQKCNNFFYDGIAHNPVLTGFVTVTSFECTDPNPGVLRLKSTVTIKPFTGNGVGEKVSILAAAISDMEPKEVVYVVGMQGTMCSKPKTTVDVDDGDVTFEEDSTCKKFKTSKEAISTSISRLSALSTNGNVSFGLVPYTFKVEFPNVNSIPPSLTKLEREPGFFKDLTDVEPLSKIIPLGKDFTNATNQINAMILSPSTTAWGRTDLGMHVAALMLDPTQKQYFNNHAVKDFSSDGKKVTKYVVLISDALNIGCCFTNNPTGNYANQYVYNYTPYNVHMLKVCDELKNQGVKIFTLLLKSNASDVIEARAENLMARCSGATAEKTTKEKDDTILLKCGIDKQECFVITEPTDIGSALDTITDTVVKTNLLN